MSSSANSASILHLIASAIKQNLGEKACTIMRTYDALLTKRDIRSIINCMSKNAVYPIRVIEYMFYVSRHRWDDVWSNALMTKSPNNMADFLSFALARAVRSKDAIAVRCLLEYGADPAALNNRAINGACYDGSTDIVRILLEDGRANPVSDNGYALSQACYNGHIDVVRLLIADPRVCVKGRAYVSSGLSNACQAGHLDITKLLMGGNINQADSHNSAIRLACSHGHTDIVKLLLDDERVDPTSCNDAIIRASENGHAEVVRVLVEDRRIDPATCSNMAIRTAVLFNYTGVVRVLLENPYSLARIDLQVDTYDSRLTQNSAYHLYNATSLVCEALIKN